MKNLIQRFIREEEGQDLVEYAFLVTFIAIFCVLVLTATGTAVNDLFQNIIDQI